MSLGNATPRSGARRTKSVSTFLVGQNASSLPRLDPQTASSLLIPKAQRYLSHLSHLSHSERARPFRTVRRRSAEPAQHSPAPGHAAAYCPCLWMHISETMPASSGVLASADILRAPNV